MNTVASPEVQIVRPYLAFEREFGQYRNWWVRDPRLVGRPLSVYLYLVSHDPHHMPTQTEAQQALGISSKTWQRTKAVLRECGFLIEIRDVYPRGYVDSEGKQRGGQKRYRLLLQDPLPGLTVPESESLIEADVPVVLGFDINSEPDISDSRATGERLTVTTADGKIPGQRGWSKIPVVTPEADSELKIPGQEGWSKIPAVEKPVVKNTTPYKEEKTNGLDRKDKDLNNPSNPSVLSAVTARETAPQPVPVPGAWPDPEQPRELHPHSPATPDSATQPDVDVQLAELLPGVGLTLAELQHELSGRVDVAGLDVVRAVRETVCRAKTPIERPAAYVARCIAREPDRWAGRVPQSRAYDPEQVVARRVQSRREKRLQEQAEARARCQAGDHNWGPASWGEALRSACVEPMCGVLRENVDPGYAAWLAMHHEGAVT